MKVEKQIRRAGGELLAVDFAVDTSTASGRMMPRQMLSFSTVSALNRRARIDSEDAWA